MELHCPSCQRRLTIPDQYAGQMMKCPLCNNTFTAPALSPVPAPATAPPAPPPLDMTTPPPAPMSVRPDEPPPLPPPPGDYVHRLNIWISPRVLPWVVLGAVVLVFLVTFFPWVRGQGGSQNAWEAAFGSGPIGADVVLIFYVLLLILLLLLSVPAAVLPLFAASFPPGMQRILSWRYAVVGGLALLTFLFLLLHMLVGFPVQHLLEVSFAYSTGFFSFAVFLHLVALITSLLALWTDLRGNRPLPRVDILW
jgi:hypothetical protein